MKAKFNGKEYRVSTCINGYGEEWFEIEEIKEVKEQPKQPQRKFKAGDKVRIKEGISSKTHEDFDPCFVEGMDEFIGHKLTVYGYEDDWYVSFYEDDYGYQFDEDWLEPWNDEKEELKDGDLAIFWDDSDEDKACLLIGIFEKSVKYGNRRVCFTMRGNDYTWDKAIKWDGTKKHIETFLKGEITL